MLTNADNRSKIRPDKHIVFAGEVFAPYRQPPLFIRRFKTDTCINQIKTVDQEGVPVFRTCEIIVLPSIAHIGKYLAVVTNREMKVAADCKAIFLTASKQSVRIIDQLAAPVSYSKAMTMNPRSLELLEEPGVTETLLRKGQKINHIRFGNPERILFSLDLSKSGHRYSYLLGIPQSDTEQILEQKLNALGVEVERGIELIAFQQNPGRVDCELKKNGEKKEKISVDYLVGANGASSSVRKALGADFNGKTLPGKWSMADVKLSEIPIHQNSLVPNEVRLTFGDKGFLFAVQFKPGTYRVASNHSSVFECLPTGVTIEEVEWQSLFNINHRLTSLYSNERVALAGDAAHVHSPIGGRGMNLGIEDAFYLAKAIVSEDLREYDRSRREASGSVLKIVNIQTTVAVGKGWGFRFLRRFIIPFVLSIPFVHRALVRRFLGINRSS